MLYALVNQLHFLNIHIWQIYHYQLRKNRNWVTFTCIIEIQHLFKTCSRGNQSCLHLTHTCYIGASTYTNTTAYCPCGSVLSFPSVSSILPTRTRTLQQANLKCLFPVTFYHTGHVYTQDKTVVSVNKGIQCLYCVGSHQGLSVSVFLVVAVKSENVTNYVIKRALHGRFRKCNKLCD